MINRAVYFLPATHDLGFERGYACFQLRDRQRIKVLARELRDRIVVATRKNLVGVHGGNVDRTGRDVNKTPG